MSFNTFLTLIPVISSLEQGAVVALSELNAKNIFHFVAFKVILFLKGGLKPFYFEKIFKLYKEKEMSLVNANVQKYVSFFI